MRAPHEPERVEERLEVLPRLVCADGEHVRPAEIGTRAVWPKPRIDPRVRDRRCRAALAEMLLHVAAGVARIDEHHVALDARAVLRPVHASRLPRHPLWMADRDEVVDRRRTESVALRRVHPVREMEDVELSDDTFHAGRPARLHATRQAWARGSVVRMQSIESPLSASRIRFAPRGPTGANATISCPASAPTSARPATMPRM